MTADTDVLPVVGPDIMRLDAAGAELVVRPESALARVSNSPATARALAAARSLVATAGPVLGPAAQRVLNWTVAAPATWVAPRLTRFATGQLMIGRVRTDATFWRPSNKVLRDVPGRAEGWSHLPGYQRAAVRFAVGVLLWTLAASLWPTQTLVVARGVAAVAGVWAAWGAARWLRTRSHRKRYLWPLHHALRNAVGSPASRPEEWLTVPPDFQTRADAEVRVDLPAAFGADDGAQNHVKTVVRNKLGLDSDCIVSFHLAGDRPYGLFRNPVRPPRRVGFADIIELINKAADTAPIIGLAAGDRPISIDLESESPHVLVSAGSGAGKSVLLRTILSQGLAKGGYGIILDIKKVSHMWANNIPNCEYHRTAEAIHDRLISLKAEIDRRNEIVVEFADIDGNTDHIDVGPRIYLLAEEMNATIGRLNAYWRSIKEKGDPNISPAVEALQDLLFMGRQIKIHVIAVAQMASARSMGGGEARENYATRCLARYTMNAWKMLVPEVWPMPKKSKITGRWQIVTAGIATATQVAYFTAREARDLSQAGISGTFTAGRSVGAVPTSQVSSESAYLGQQPGTVPAVSDEADAGNGVWNIPEDAPAQVLVGLRDAIQNAIVDGWTIENLRKARTRYYDFPAHVTQRGQELLYDADELGRWSRNRRTQAGPGDIEDDSTATDIPLPPPLIIDQAVDQSEAGHNS